MDASIDDGYIKYTSTRRDGRVPPSAGLGELKRARTTLMELAVVGA